MGSPQTWTDQETSDLRRLHAAGLTMTRISKKLPGKTRNAVLSKVHRLGLPPREPGQRSDLAPKAKLAVRRSVSGLAVRLRTERAHPKPEPAPLPKTPASDVARKTMAQLGHQDCRWPVGDPREPGFGFCGLPQEGGPYCAEHKARAYQRVRP